MPQMPITSEKLEATEFGTRHRRQADQPHVGIGPHDGLFIGFHVLFRVEGGTQQVDVLVGDGGEDLSVHRHGLQCSDDCRQGLAQRGGGFAQLRQARLIDLETVDVAHQRRGIAPHGAGSEDVRSQLRRLLRQIGQRPHLVHEGVHRGVELGVGHRVFIQQRYRGLREIARLHQRLLRLFGQGIVAGGIVGPRKSGPHKRVQIRHRDAEGAGAVAHREFTQLVADRVERISRRTDIGARIGKRLLNLRQDGHQMAANPLCLNVGDQDVLFSLECGDVRLDDVSCIFHEGDFGAQVGRAFGVFHPRGFHPRLGNHAIDRGADRRHGKYPPQHRQQYRRNRGRHRARNLYGDPIGQIPDAKARHHKNRRPECPAPQQPRHHERIQCRDDQYLARDLAGKKDR